MRNAIWTIGFAGLLCLVALTFAIWRGDQSFGIAKLWERVAGPPDLGPVNFADIRRSPTGNDALICPVSLCGATPVDAVSPNFNVPVARLRDAVRVIEVNDPDVFALAQDEARVQDRYLARTRIMRFPDTVSVRFIDLGQGRSTLALYSRSQLGQSDIGVNRARLLAWIKLLGDQLPPAQP